MSVAFPNRRRVTSVRDWLKPRIRRITVPSWLLSGVVHWGLLMAVMSLPELRGCRPDMAGDGGDSLSMVGLFLDPVAGSADPGGGGGESGSMEEPIEEFAGSPFESTMPQPPSVPTTPPTALHLPPVAGPSLSGPPLLASAGPPRTSTGVNHLLSSSRNRGTGSGQGEGGGHGNGTGEGTGDGSGRGATSMFGIGDGGGKFVYVIDSSSSMGNFNALRVAKAELLGSLERLTPEQQFQVLFCNSAQTLMLDAGGGRSRQVSNMFFGTDSQRLEVSLQIAAVSPDAGTEHKKGLLEALAFNPDVIFFLTDAGVPELLPSELAEIRRTNRGARIHCIHFGEGALLTDASGQPVGNFLQTLASQNNGKYTYRDVRQFVRR